MNKVTRLRSWRKKLVGIAMCLMAFAFTANAQIYSFEHTSTALDGAAMVSISSNGSSIGSGETMLPAGSEIVLSVTPAEGFKFLKWDGDVSVTPMATTITITLDRSKKIRSRIAEIVPITAFGTNYTKDDVNMEISLDLMNNQRPSLDLIFPDTYEFDGTPYKVTSMGTTYTSGVNFSNKKNVLSIKLPKDLKVIKGRFFSETGALDNAFPKTQLKTIQIPKGVEVLDAYCFYKADLSEFSFEEGSKLNYMAFRAFSGTAGPFPLQLPMEREDATASWSYKTNQKIDNVDQPVGDYIAIPDGIMTSGAGQVLLDGTVAFTTVNLVGAYIYAEWTPRPKLNITAEHGTVAVSPEQNYYTPGTEVVLTATPAENYKFDSWMGDISATTATATVTMDAVKNITALFAPEDFYSMNITAVNGSVAIDPITNKFFPNSVGTITATADDHYLFTNWSGDVSSTEATISVTMDANKNITANFEQIMYSVNVTADGGVVSKTPNQATYEFGTVVSLTVAADAGYQFVDWSTNNSTDATITVTVDGNKDVTANFLDMILELTVTSALNSTGSVSVSPDKAHYDRGEEVVITATPAAGHLFKNWTGDATGTASVMTITMDKVKDITANFRYAMYSISLSATNGTITKTPDQALYLEGDKVVLAATPDAGYKFDGFYSRDINEKASVYTLTVTKSIEVGGIFTNLPIVLNITKQTGGKVTIVPNLSVYTKDQSVTLTAVPSSANFRFDGWVGDIGANVNSDDETITITMSEAKDLVAQFVNMTAIDQVENTIAVAVYPNPSQALFTVSMQEDAIGTYAIYTLAGQLVQSGAAEGEFSFDLSSQAKGIYALKLTTNKGVAVQKIVLEK